MKYTLCLGITLFLAMALSGCGSGSSSNAPTAQSSSTTLVDRLTLTLKVDTTQVPVGGAVSAQIVLSNGTSAAITSSYYGYAGNIFAFPVGGILVRDSAGAFIGTDGAALLLPPLPAPTPVPVTLQPGATLQFAVKYTFVRADTYTISAEVTPTPGMPEQAGSFTVTAR